MAFSGAVQLTGLDDYISPSQECIKPIKRPKSSGVIRKKGKIKLADDGTYYQTNEYGAVNKMEKAKITLNDCLACSGCITSAESVLITQQSTEELNKILQSNRNAPEIDRKYIVVSVSPQSQASLAVKHSLSMREIALALTNYFLHIGASLVLDTSYARQIALQESAKEFIQNYKEKVHAKENTNIKFPILTSSCPGWICYAEKTHGPLIVPHISRVKSPQQIIGSLVKEIIPKFLNSTPDKVYHITVMPCYDKKLEASRQDFYNDLYSTRDVDLVLTSSEVDSMLKDANLNFGNFLQENFENSIQNDAEGYKTIEKMYLSNEHQLNNEGGGSGGYLTHVFKKAAHELFGVNVSGLHFTPIRNNKDFQEVVLEDEMGVRKMKFAHAYGFRSIQNLVQKMKRGKCDYDYVEVMACPSGCLNGGGQVKSASNDRDEQRKLVHEVNTKYNEVPHVQSPELLTNETYKILEQNMNKLNNITLTQYHIVEPDPSMSLNIKW